MLIDEVRITITSGSGGDGRVSFYSPKGKPSGGDGGVGGSVYACINPQMSSLAPYAQTPIRRAQEGSAGATFNKTGKNGADLTLFFPIGTQLKDTETGELIELQEGAEPVLLCAGGRGGWGNAHYMQKHPGSFSTALSGKPGVTRTFLAVMRLIADCGLVGLPNAGKSSLLNALTDAQAKVANYPFTTLEPNLGVLIAKSRDKRVNPPTPRLRRTRKEKDDRTTLATDTNTYEMSDDGPRTKNLIVIADIPGLIEGASQGKGLGHKFLKHIEKVKVILHCISCETNNLEADYQLVRGELLKYNPSLGEKQEIIVLTKEDTLWDDAVRQNLYAKAQKLASTVVFVSVLKDTTISDLTDLIASSA